MRHFNKTKLTETTLITPTIIQTVKVKHHNMQAVIERMFPFKDFRDRSAIMVSEVKFGAKIMPAYSPLDYSPPQSRSFVYLLPLLPQSLTSERLCQPTDVSEDIICVSKDIVSLKATFITGLHKILHIGQ